MPQPTINLKDEELTTFDVLMEQRRFNQNQTQQRQLAQGINQATNPLLSRNMIPPELSRTYQLVIVPGEFGKKHITKLREVRAKEIGSLVTIRGIVTRASDVKPCIQVAVNACDICGYEIYVIVQTKEFNPLIECPSDKCKKNNIKG